jgi:hypothetical protein
VDFERIIRESEREPVVRDTERAVGARAWAGAATGDTAAGAAASATAMKGVSETIDLSLLYCSSNTVMQAGQILCANLLRRVPKFGMAARCSTISIASSSTSSSATAG